MWIVFTYYVVRFLLIQLLNDIIHTWGFVINIWAQIFMRFHCWMGVHEIKCFTMQEMWQFILEKLSPSKVHELRFAKSSLKFIHTNIIERRIKYIWIPTEFFSWIFSLHLIYFKWNNFQKFIAIEALYFYKSKLICFFLNK